MKFVDEATIEVIAGKGGNGVASFRREKFIPKGGPDGGDGGRGGSIRAVADRNINTLVDFRYARKHVAKNGENGRGSDQYGAAAPDIVLRMPVGTMVYDADTGELLHDLNRHGMEVTLAAGGEGGLGNLHFKSSTNRAPRQCTPGKPGEHRRLRLELKVLADVGLLGLPNAGKSTLISKVSNARPKIADYPFTTLKPQLGVAGVNDRELVIADIPGLIKGASEGVGIGTRFLGHIERCRVLLHLVDGTNDSPTEAYRTVRAELAAYGAGLDEKPEIVALNKIDAIEPRALSARRRALEKASGRPVHLISAVSGDGVREVLQELAGIVDQDRASTSAPAGPQGEEEARPWSPLDN